MCYIDSLSLKQKININKKIKSKKNIYNFLQKHVNNNPNIEKIFQLFNYIKKSSFNLKELEKLFKSEFFANVEKFHIPLIYGTNELKNAAFLSDVNSFLFDNHFEYKTQSYSNMYKKIQECDKDIIIEMNKKNMEEIKEKASENKNNQENLNDKEKQISIRAKYGFLYNFINKIFDEEEINIFGPKKFFTEDDLRYFSDKYTLNNKFSFEYYNLLNIDFILYC